MDTKLIEANRRYDEALYNYMMVDTSEENARALKRASKDLNETIDAIEAGAETSIVNTMTNGELFRFAWAAVRTAIENSKKMKDPDNADIRRLESQETELKGLMERSFTK
ncbi:hypothetical protein FACS18949_11790 [Clostridia bacterium]|nr:hypothetical protein FACS18949_11790 [Clostridia bacterium]